MYFTQGGPCGLIEYMKVDKKVIETLQSGGIGILPTDTIYGVVGSVLNKETIESMYPLLKRDSKKPMVIIIGRVKDLGIFGIKINRKFKKKLKEFWPGRVSIILPCHSDEFAYLHRGMESLAFRVPNLKWLRKLLKKTGPLVATSANPEGEKPAQTIKQAEKYFDSHIDFYVDAGKMAGKPSTLVEIEDSNVNIKRDGAVKITGVGPK